MPRFDDILMASARGHEQTTITLITGDTFLCTVLEHSGDTVKVLGPGGRYRWIRADAIIMAADTKDVEPPI